MLNAQIGIMFRREYLPETLPTFAQKAEALGFDELWVVEDCFYTGGIAQAGIALASTQSITVGLGIMPAVARNAAFSAMEIATLSRIYPKRFLPGIGHGVRDWINQIGALPKSQLKALEHYTAAIRAILSGENIDFASEYVQLDAVQLEYPLDDIPPVSLGVRGPKSLKIAGRVADGTIMAEGASPAYVRWAIEQIRQGQVEAGRSNEHRVTVYVLWTLNEDMAQARQDLRPKIAAMLGYGGAKAIYTEPLGITDEVQVLFDNGGVANLRQNMPDEWIGELAVLGNAENCQQTIQRFIEAGADSVVLVPIGDAETALNENTAQLLQYLKS